MNNKVYSVDEISAILSPIIMKYKADSAILFGSYAKNTADSESDIDVMVIGGSAFDPTDIFCIADELNRKSQKRVDVYEQREIVFNSSLYNNIMKEGVVVV